jgi:hypothetical protein
MAHSLGAEQVGDARLLHPRLVAVTQAVRSQPGSSGQPVRDRDILGGLRGLPHGAGIGSTDQVWPVELALAAAATKNLHGVSGRGGPSGRTASWRRSGLMEHACNDFRQLDVKLVDLGRLIHDRWHY